MKTRKIMLVFGSNPSVKGKRKRTVLIKKQMIIPLTESLGSLRDFLNLEEKNVLKKLDPKVF